MSKKEGSGDIKPETKAFLVELYRYLDKHPQQIKDSLNFFDNSSVNNVNPHTLHMRLRRKHEITEEAKRIDNIPFEEIKAIGMQNITYTHIKKLDEFSDKLFDNKKNNVNDFDKKLAYIILVSTAFENTSKQHNYRLDDETKEYFKNRYSKILRDFIDNSPDETYYASTYKTLANSMIVNDYQYTHFLCHSGRYKDEISLENINYFLNEIKNPDNTIDDQRIEKYATNIYKILDANTAIHEIWINIDQKTWEKIQTYNSNKNHQPKPLKK